MNEDEIIPKKELRRVYAEILRGSSGMSVDKTGDIYVKHLGVWDTELLDERKDDYYNHAKEKGLPNEKEKLSLLERDELWSVKRENELKELKNFVERMKLNKGKLLLKSEIKRTQKEIDKTTKQITSIEREKRQLVGLTAEIYSEKRSNDYYIFLTLYKDLKFEEPLFSQEEFDELSEVDLGKVISAYNGIADRFSEHNMKRVALSPFFLNNYYLCKDNPFIFFGKPLIELSYHQVDLFSYGRYFKHVLSEMKQQPPPDIMEDPDKLLEMYNIQQNKEKLDDGKDHSGVASTIPGATKEDLEALGMTADSHDGSVIDLNAEIAKKGKGMDMDELIKLHGM